VRIPSGGTLKKPTIRQSAGWRSSASLRTSTKPASPRYCPEFYIPSVVHLANALLVLRTKGDPMRFAGAIRKAVLAVDPINRFPTSKPWNRCYTRSSAAPLDDVAARNRSRVSLYCSPSSACTESSLFRSTSHARSRHSPGARSAAIRYSPALSSARARALRSPARGSASAERSHSLES